MKSDSNSYRLEASLGFVVNRTARSMSHILRRSFLENGYDFTPEQWGIMHFLYENNGVNQQDLAAISFRDKTNITRIVKGLERRGLIARIPDPKDRRQNQIFLTREGMRLRDAVLPLVKKLRQKAMAGLTDEQIETTKLVLNQVFDNLNSDSKIK